MRMPQITLFSIANISLLLLFTAMLALPCYGSGKEKTVTPKPNEVIFEVHGIVCSFCSKGVQKKLSKLDFVDQSRFIKGVHVGIKEQLVTVAIKPDAKPDVQEAFRQIRSGGYDPIHAFVLDKDGQTIRIKPEKTKK